MSDFARDELWQLYKAGRLSIKVHPCAIGDTVYRILVRGQYVKAKGYKVSKLNAHLGISINLVTLLRRVLQDFGDFTFKVSEVKCTESDRTLMGKYVFDNKDAAESYIHELELIQETYRAKRNG